jgi:hypothetical protein
MSAIPGLLSNIAPDDIRQVAGMITQVIGSGDALSAPEQARLKQVSTLFEQAIRQVQAASAPAMPSANDPRSTVADTRPKTASPKPKAPQKTTVSKTPVAPQIRQTRRGKSK